MDKKEKEIEKERSRFEELTQRLDSALEDGGKDSASIRYFSSNQDYWATYNEEVSNLGVDSEYRIINNMRLSLSFLPEEVSEKPGLRSMIERDLRGMKNKRFTLHHMVNVESLVRNIKRDLDTEDERKRSISQLLAYYSREDLKQQHRITLAPEFRNILIAIIGSSVFLEFYPPGEHTEISSAVQLSGGEVAGDFARWFDAYSDGEGGPEEDFEKFRHQLLQKTEQVMRIKKAEIEESIEEVEFPFG